MLSLFRKPAPEPFDAAGAVRLHAEGRLTLLDIRDPDEVAHSGKAIGALVIPLAEVAFRADPASPGFLAAFAAGHPRRLGYTEVANIGGLADWTLAGGGRIEPGA